MTDSNTYNFQDYTQNQAIDYGTNQIQSNTEIDPSTYLQGDSAILQASAGLGETTTENVDYLNQNNFDTNAIFGETIKKISEIPYGQNFQGTTTTTTSNIIDGNTLFGDNNALISNTTTQEVQGTTTDVNSFFNNTNFDTNAIYGQTQILPETTATTTTNENTYFTQPQEIQGTTTYGETQILPSTDSNTYYGTTQINYEQPQTQNDYTTSYQTTNTIDLNNLNLNNYNFGTTNIDALINSAYIIMGLLYGQGDFYKTIDVSTRCGKDSDCNPASSGGILGVILGYDGIPDYWKKGMAEVEDRNLAYTDISMNKTYQMSFNQALKVIERYDGKIGDNDVTIKTQTPEAVRLEQAFEGHWPIKRNEIRKPIQDVAEQEFNGKGVVVTYQMPMDKKDAPTGYVAEVEIYLDGALDQTVKLPADNNSRRLDLYFKYDMPLGNHKVSFKVKNPDKAHPIEVRSMIIYSDKPAPVQHQ